MGRLKAVEHLSLDGFMQGPGRPDEDTRDGFDLGGWAAAALGSDPAGGELKVQCPAACFCAKRASVGSLCP